MIKLANLHIITCVATAQRLPDLLKNLQPLINASFIKDIRLVCKNDVGYNGGNFSSRMWADQINKIYPILAKNIVASSGNRQSVLEILDLEATQVFPERPLKATEMSLLCKHYQSLSMVDDVTITIEDDAFISDNALSRLHELIEIAEDHNWYIDMGMFHGLECRGRLLHTDSGNAYYYQAIGLTRTTSAFIVNPKVAEALRSSYWPCALPADLHHQYLLVNANIAGAWPSVNIFQNLSLTGSFESAIS